MIIRALITSSLLTLAVSACGDDEQTGSGPDTSCPATQTDRSALTSTTHSGSINADTTWAAADSPHILTGNVAILNATLTVDPCAVVLLDPGVHLVASTAGNLQAVGAADEPIVFAPNGASRWGYVEATEDGYVNLANVLLQGGGANLTTYGGATLIADGPTNRPYVNNLEVHDVTITDSAGYGVWMARHTAFVAGSRGLSIMGAGADDFTHPSPLRIDAQALGSVPSGVYTGNAIDQIEIDPFVTIEKDVIIADHGVPYWVSSSKEIYVARPFNTTGAIPQLTVAAGVTLAFAPGSNSGLRVGTNTNPPQPGSLVVSGTADNPVTFTSAAATPAPGDWQGIVFAPGAGASGATQMINNATIEYAGGNVAIGGYACASTDVSGNFLSEDGAVVIYGWAPGSAFVTNSALQHSLGWGVFRGWDTSMGADVAFTATNTFADLEACEQNQLHDNVCATPVVYGCAGTI